MKKLAALYILANLWLYSCQKADNGTEGVENNRKEFIKYTIFKGKQYADSSLFTKTEYTSQKFQVKFDSTAIYRTRDSANQDDINKLYGFADNDGHHQDFSARIGWRWSKDSLRLFAYVYNNAIRNSQEIITVVPAQVISCSISITSTSYIFTVNGKQLIMPRASTTPTAKGYRLYPYFGGDELAPHDIHIWINEE